MSDEALLLAVKRGQSAEAARCLEEGASADASDRWGVSALSHAAARGDLEVLEMLLAAGAEVDRPSAAGNTALMQAAARGQDTAVERLLAAGANAGHKNKWGFGAKDWSSWPNNGARIEGMLRDSG